MFGNTRSTATRAACFALGLAAAWLAPLPAAAQAQDTSSAVGTEVGNFGDVPFQNRQLVLTRPEDRAAWRALEDKHIGERRALEDRMARMLLDLMQQQANERDEFLRARSR